MKLSTYAVVSALKTLLLIFGFLCIPGFFVLIMIPSEHGITVIIAVAVLLTGFLSFFVANVCLQHCGQTGNPTTTAAPQDVTRVDTEDVYLPPYAQGNVRYPPPACSGELEFRELPYYVDDNGRIGLDRPPSYKTTI